MGHVDVSGINYTLSDGRVLLSDITFRVGDGAKAALVGPNGAGKTTLMRLIAGDITAETGIISRSGGLGVMRQFIGSVRNESTVRDLLISVAPEPIRRAANALDQSETTMMEVDDEKSQMAYAQALSDWADVGGYDWEVLWDFCCTAALSSSFDEVRYRAVNTLSGGEQKRIVLEALLRGPDEVLLLDEPDNYLDVPGKRWLEESIKSSTKTIFFISHDRELLSHTANRVIAVEEGAAGSTAWTHGSDFESWHHARRSRNERMAELLRRWEEAHQHLKDLVRTLQQQAANSPAMAGKYSAMQTRLRKFEEAGPPEAPPPTQDVRMKLRGGRTGMRAVTCAQLELENLTSPFDFEIFYGDRVAVLGANGSGKSHFLRLLGGDPKVHFKGEWKLGARVVTGLFAQTHAHPEFVGKELVEILWLEHSLQRGPAVSVLRRYELENQVDQEFQTLSGGQQARLQILLLELEGATLLLLDEPTDNLDLASAEALETGLESFDGTVVAVTHDRWFTKGFDRFLVFGNTGQVRESPQPVWGDW
jgi:ATPase subunit of ABC transporter with duplicated ATPase domains